jgi:galactokinase
MSGPRDFRAVFGEPPQALAWAPGRVNLLGEHTDYNDGFVLPIAIAQQTQVGLRRNGLMDFRLYAQSLDEQVAFTFDAPPRAHFATYVFGCLAEARHAGFDIPALDIHVASEVPMGVGLSSSAALEVATLRALRALLGLPLDDVQIARLAQQAEVRHAGVRCGLMDQMASSLAGTDRALLLDTRSLARREVLLPPHSAILVVDSGEPRTLAASGYNERRAQCEQAAQLLGVSTLRDLPDLEAAQALPGPLPQRVRHVLTENARVLQAADCTNAQDFGGLMNASHASLRDDYEVSTPAIDRLVALLQAHPAVFGARLTGAGFGGACVALCLDGAQLAIADAVLPAYAAAGGRARVLVPAPAAAAAAPAAR